MMVVAGGRVLFEYGDVAESNKVASVRKSVLGMLYGRHVAKDPRLLHATVKELGLEDLRPFSKVEERATLEHLLTARSGIYLQDGDTYSPRPGTLVPGLQFSYNNWDFNAAGTAFEKVAGQGIYEAVETDLARPLGLQDYKFSMQKKVQMLPDRKVSVHAEYPMSLSTRDMARLGLLMARQGRWRDQQVLPVNWVNYLTAVTTSAPDLWPRIMQLQFGTAVGRWGYGVMWWVWDSPRGTVPSRITPYTGMYSAIGRGGQFITVIPSLDLVVAHQCSTGLEDPAREVGVFSFQTILQMLVDSSR